MSSFIPFILCGGSGTRLWPTSRASMPKQYCDLFGVNLFETTMLRFAKAPKVGVVSTAAQLPLIERSTPETMKGTPKIRILEPAGRNTAPAIALAVRALDVAGESAAVMGIFPADHYIADEKAFLDSVEKATKIAEGGAIVTLGIKPTFPATGYGYIETRTGPSDANSRIATRFHEKPDAARAASYLESGSFFWNAGIFFARVDTLKKAFQTHAKELWAAVEKIEDPLSPTKEEYSAIPSISFDVAIMEKLPEHVCVPTDCGWSDVGSWDSLVSTLGGKASESENVVKIGSAGSHVLPHRDRKVVVIDSPDTNVIDTADGLLVFKTGSSEKVKTAYEELVKRKMPEATAHPFEYRPWGDFEILRDTDAFKSKVIHVLPGQRLSYQSHAKRAEHWIIIRGQAEVTLNDQVLRPKPGEHIFIPQGAKHRMSNPGTEPVEFVEVQVGTYFGEDDIVRYQDDYKRS
ncbi:MAG: mannose-1-phosphate guanylyltransferase/mannose-6-phosphate isomerase [Bdellovibrionales bacterium]|nr:mannose-1-phosphate guanylyltransferase/mannose-6-phosphate isomerase [Bdellovibrionales bacterium]